MSAANATAIPTRRRMTPDDPDRNAVPLYCLTDQLR